MVEPGNPGGSDACRSRRSAWRACRCLGETRKTVVRRLASALRSAHGRVLGDEVAIARATACLFSPVAEEMSEARSRTAPGGGAEGAATAADQPVSVVSARSLAVNCSR